VGHLAAGEKQYRSFPVSSLPQGIISLEQGLYPSSLAFSSVRHWQPLGQVSSPAATGINESAASSTKSRSELNSLFDIIFIQLPDGKISYTLKNWWIYLYYY
jgi:hypothetical protein